MISSLSALENITLPLALLFVICSRVRTAVPVILASRHVPRHILEYVSRHLSLLVVPTAIRTRVGDAVRTD